MKSPGFSSFRALMDDWDEYLENEDIEEKINNFLNNHDFVLYFKKDNEIFGAPEESRMTFAKMKSSDDDMPKGWLEDANFSAQNLSKALEGINNQTFVDRNNINKIKVIDQDDAKGLLITKAKKLGPKGLKLQSRRIIIVPRSSD